MKKRFIFLLCFFMLCSFSAVYGETSMELVEDTADAEGIETRSIQTASVGFTRSSSLVGRLTLSCVSMSTADYIQADVTVYKLSGSKYVYYDSTTVKETNTASLSKSLTVNVNTSGTYYCEVVYTDKVGTKYTSTAPMSTSAVGL